YVLTPSAYTRFDLAMSEAMLIGLPVVGLGTTEMTTAVQNGVSGYVSTDVDWLVARMRDLLADPAQARALGEGARRVARERFAIGRFTAEWNDAFAEVTGVRAMPPSDARQSRPSAAHRNAV